MMSGYKESVYLTVRYVAALFLGSVYPMVIYQNMSFIPTSILRMTGAGEESQKIQSNTKFLMIYCTILNILYYILQHYYMTISRNIVRQIIFS